ncbi:hypothetical protein IQ22_02769 [Pseudomonas duriflava]|uniref:4-amino-4-deoxy-L-arabinose transferase-like glycosyltransferase n=1 Tax=Pseudomonas duriflava TaxID=459528 RepID=A0A562QBJ0_9PSED|nr:hypothetical protein [Pseudomonas duriflava]TWI53550.1 hypothetical protein IQ22_02769 [Pseudomonas duriflava]
MPNPSTNVAQLGDLTPVRSLRLVGVAVLFVFSCINFFTLGTGQILDPFHQGEYFATLPNLLQNDAGGHAFTIHGALDYLPAWIAIHISSLETHFLYTQVLYALCNFGAALLLYLIASLYVERGERYELLILLTIAAVASYLVGYRDLFLLLSIFLFLLCLRASRSSDFYLLATLLGVTAAFNMFWSYDRGITGLGAVGFGVLIASFGNKRFLYAMAVFFATFFVLASFTEVFALSDYVRNLDFLLSTSSQWTYRTPRFLIQTALLTIPTLLAYYALFKAMPRPFRFSTSLATIGMVAVLMLMLYKVATNRADFIHIPMGMWAPMIAFLFAHDQARKGVAKEGEVLARPYIAMAMIGALLLLGLVGKNPMPFFVVLLGLVFIHKRQKPLGYTAYLAIGALLIAFTLYKSPVPGVLANGFRWIPSLAQPPRNELLVSEGARWAAYEIERSGASCVFDLSNNGIINGITALPACTKYIYPVYATRVYEQDMIADLRRSEPPAVIYSSTFWSFSIDDLSMHDKFPELKKYLDEKYPYERCESEYCLRFKNLPE